MAKTIITAALTGGRNSMFTSSVRARGIRPVV